MHLRVKFEVTWAEKMGAAVPLSCRAGTPSNTMWPGPRSTSKWRLHPLSRLATINMGQKLGGGGCAFRSAGSWVPIEHKVAWSEAYLHTKCHLNPSSRLATTDISRKLGDCAPLGEGKLGPHLTQRRLG